MATKSMALSEYVLYMRDALNRFQASQEIRGPKVASFTQWWRSFHDQLRKEHPKTIEMPVNPATNDVEEFKANLPTRPRGRGPKEH